MFRLPFAAAIAVALSCAVAVSPAAAQPVSTYSGQAIALRASVLGIGATFADIGPLPSSGGSQRASFVGVTIPGLLTTGALTASTQGRGNHSRSRSSVGDVELSLLGLGIAAEALRSEAEASCQGGEPQVAGSSAITGLTVAGQPIVFVGLPNVVIPLPLGITLTLNEQTSSTSGSHGEITVNAVHLTGPGIDVVLASSYADVDCAAE
jgi:hypothetical protein